MYENVKNGHRAEFDHSGTQVIHRSYFNNVLCTFTFERALVLNSVILA